MDKENKEVTNEVTEIKQEVNNEVTEKEIKSKYTLKPAGAPDIFTMVTILGKIGINNFASCLNNENIQDLVKKIKEKRSFSSDDLSTIAGLGVMTEVSQIVIMGLPKCENEVYKLLSNTSDLEIDEIKKLDGVTFIEMIMDFFTINWDFIKAASKFVK